MYTPKELVFDIETSGYLMFGFGLGKQNVSYTQLLTTCKIVCICWRFRDEPEDVWHSLKWDHDKQCDKVMIEKFIKVAEKADVIIGQNHERFDIRYVNERIAYHRLKKQLPIIVTDDLYKMVKKKLYLPCYKLDYMAKHYGFGTKMHTDLQLWIDIVYNKDKKALGRMIEYCGRDVVLTDKIFTHLEPYLDRKIIGSVWHEDPLHCRQVNCNGKLRIRKYRLCKNLMKKSQYSCTECGKWVTFGSNELLNPRGYTR